MYIYKLLFFRQMKERWSSLKRVSSCSKQDNYSFNSSLSTPKKGKEPNLPRVLNPLVDFWLFLDFGYRNEIWVTSDIRDPKRFVAAAQRSPRCSSSRGFLIGGGMEPKAFWDESILAVTEGFKWSGFLHVSGPHVITLNDFWNIGWHDFCRF